MGKLVIKDVRFSYCSLTTPKVPLSGDDAKYQTTILLPKSNLEMKKAIDAALTEAMEEGIKSKWNGVRPPTLAVPIHDGDGPRPSDGMPYGDECKGHWVFTASSTVKPQVVNKQILPIVNESDIYSGMYGNVSVNFFPYNKAGKKGIGVGLNNVMKTEEGDSLAGRSSALSDFAEFAEPGDFAYQAPVPVPIQYDPITGLPVTYGGVK